MTEYLPFLGPNYRRSKRLQEFPNSRPAEENTGQRRCCDHTFRNSLNTKWKTHSSGGTFCIMKIKFLENENKKKISLYRS